MAEFNDLDLMIVFRDDDWVESYDPEVKKFRQNLKDALDGLRARSLVGLIAAIDNSELLKDLKEKPYLELVDGVNVYMNAPADPPGYVELGSVLQMKRSVLTLDLPVM